MMKRQYILKEKLDQGKHVEAFKAVKAVDQNEVVVAIKKLIDPKNKLHLEAFNRQKDILRKIKNQKYALQMLDELYYKDLNFVGLVLEFYDCLFVIADFEHSKIINQQEEQLLNSNQIQDFQTGYDEQEINVFPIGKLLIELFLSRRLTIEENQQIKSKNFLEIIPEIISTENKKFVNEVLANMLNLDQRQRLQPFALIQKIKEFQVDESSLKLLNLASNQKENLEKLTNIVSLTVNLGETYSGEAIQLIGEALEKFKKINYLNLCYDSCFTNSQQIQTFGMSLEKLQSLTQLTLNFHCNFIKKEAVKSLGVNIQKLQKLTNLNLDLSDIQNDEEGEVSLAKSLKTLKNLVTLKLNLKSFFYKYQNEWPYLRKMFLKMNKLVVITI
ncbi:hypothetical protein ABPG74_019909 [Tetrahymena malaccensis]